MIFGPDSKKSISFANIRGSNRCLPDRAFLDDQCPLMTLTGHEDSKAVFSCRTAFSS